MLDNVGEEQCGNGNANASANGNGNGVSKETMSDKENVRVEPERKTTPPPKLPELEALGTGVREARKDGGWLGGGDMFKGI